MKIGDHIRVVNTGNTYSTWAELASLLGATHWENDCAPEIYSIGRIVNIKYIEGKNRNICLIDVKGQEYLIGEEGIEVFIPIKKVDKRTKTTGFRVGDWVRSRQPGHKYEGRILKIEDDYVYVFRFDSVNPDSGGWLCDRLENGRVATASAAWDKKSYLEFIKSSGSKESDKQIIMSTLLEKIMDEDAVLIKQNVLKNEELDLNNEIVREAIFTFPKFKAHLVKTIKKNIAERGSASDQAPF